MPTLPANTSFSQRANNDGVNNENWELHLKLVCDQLNEKHRRWVAGRVHSAFRTFH